MLIIELRDRLIEEGIKSVKKTETRPERVKGGITGFELCRTLGTPQDYERVLLERHKEERRRQREYYESQENDGSSYWEYRMATVQIEFVYERLKVVWMMGGSYSASAALHVNRILKSQE